jgi:hypothetical protein
VLFLDEFTEFRRDAIEGLRQPLGDGRVVVPRMADRCTRSTPRSRRRMSLSTVQSWWSGRKAPRYEHLLRLRRVLGALPFEEVAR